MSWLVLIDVLIDVSMDILNIVLIDALIIVLIGKHNAIQLMKQHY